MKFLKGFRRLSSPLAITALMIAGLAAYPQVPGKDQAAKAAPEPASSPIRGGRHLQNLPRRSFQWSAED